MFSFPFFAPPRGYDYTEVFIAARGDWPLKTYPVVDAKKLGISKTPGF